MPDPTPAPAATPGTPATDDKVQNAAPAAAGGGSPAPAGGAAPAAAAAPAGDAAAGVAPAGAPAGEPKAWFPDDWRVRLAGSDEKLLGALSRYNSPADVAKAMREAQTRIAAGEVRQPLPANPTPEQLATWRQANGVPEKPEGYLEKLPQGLVIGEDDKPVVGEFAAALHAANAPPDVVHAALGWYNKYAESQQAAVSELDKSDKAALEDAMRTEWGGEFRSNVNGISAFLETTLPDETARAAFINARGADGTALMNNPAVVRWLAAQAREARPELFTTIVQPGQSVHGQGMLDRKTEIEKLMGNKGSAYWKGPGAEKMQKEYRDLVDALERQKSRSAA